jgi:acetyltransferase-like isoleucine patch superfamily enzyme
VRLNRAAAAHAVLNVTKRSEAPFEDPLSWIHRLRTKCHTLWLKFTYPFHSFADGVSIDYTCDISRSVAHRISIGESAYLAPGVWLNVSGDWDGREPSLVLGKGCKIGRRSMISSKNLICVGDHVLFSPSVLVMDHNHEYANPNLPILDQGITDGGTVTIGPNCWIGYGAVIFAGKGELFLGRNSIVGANAVVTKSFPEYSVVAGNPARLVKRFDPASNQWARIKESVSRDRAGAEIQSEGL